MEILAQSLPACGRRERIGVQAHQRLNSAWFFRTHSPCGWAHQLPFTNTMFVFLLEENSCSSPPPYIFSLAFSLPQPISPSLPPHSLSLVQPHRLFSLSLVLSVSSRAVRHSSVWVFTLPLPLSLSYLPLPHSSPLTRGEGGLYVLLAEMGHISFTLVC